jgi:hypothetical protein
LLVTAAGWLARARGPLWLGANSDPSYQYLLNALLLLDGGTPAHVDHPGTTVQMLGAAALRLLIPAADPAERIRAVLAAPEAALAGLHAVTLTLTAAAVTLAGLLVRRRGGSPWSVMAVQLSPLLLPVCHRATLGFDPEALLLPVTVLYVSLLVVRVLPPAAAAAEGKSGGRDILLGLLAGAGLVTKITFAPLCLLPLVLAGSLRQAAVTAGAGVAAGLVCVLPVASELSRWFDWLGRLATHRGTYGTGATGFIDPANYLANAGRLLTAEPLLPALLLASALAAGAILRLQSADTALRRRATQLLAVTAVQAGAVLLVAKHPHPRYLLPATLSLALNAVLLLEVIRGWPGDTGRWIGRTLLVALAAGGAVYAGRALPGLAAELADTREQHLAHHREAEALSAGGRRVDYYRSSSVEYALAFGNASARHRFAAELAEIHPHRVFFNVWTGLFEDFAGPMPPREVFAAGPLFLVGAGAIENLPPGIRLPRPAGWELTVPARRQQLTIHRLAPPPAGRPRRGRSAFTPRPRAVR